MKKILAVLCAAGLIISMTACAGAKSYSGQTVTGQVTEIEGTTITLQLGELSESEGGPGGQDQQGQDQQGQQAPPEKPEGSSDSESGDQSTIGQEQQGQQAPPDMPGGMGRSSFTAGDESVSLICKSAEITIEKGSESEDGELDDIQVGDILEVEVGAGNVAKTITVKSAGGAMGDAGGSGQENQGSAANSISEDGTYSEESYTSDGDDENALRVEDAKVTLDGIRVEKSGGSCSDSDAGNFYGMNAALLATDGATVTIKNAKVSSDASNGNAIFSYGSGTTVNVSDTTIDTSSDNSGGIQTAGGGTTNATNLTIHTKGNSSAAIRSDRGGGTVNVNGGTYVSSGYNSPAVYSTAAITVKNATLTAENSEALVIEGQNSIALENCEVSGKMSDTEGASSAENVHNVMIYQSMSGDAEVGTSEFSMTGGTLESNNGDMFYVTNTNCVVKLSGVDLIQNDADAYLLNVCGNNAQQGWGTAGENGGNVEFTADDQTLSGNIVVDSISTLKLTLSGNSTFTGTINITENAQGGTAVDNNAAVTVEEGSTWVLTGNCTISTLENNGTIQFNGYTITLADGTVLQ